MKRGFLELNELKKDMTNRQEIYETQQIRELRREIKRLENELQDATNLRTDAQKFASQMKIIIDAKDSEISRLLGGMQ